MDQALDPEAYIYEGFWRNLSKGTTRNLTLTLCPTYSVILTNALALFVAMSGGQLWTIIRFTLHQIRTVSRPDNMSKTHNQQQVVLRNTTTDIATARLMLYLAWSYRRCGKGAIATCVMILVLAILNAVFFMVAGTFSNTLVNAGTSVLSISPFCGVWNQTYFNIAGFGNNPTSIETLSLSTEFTASDVEEVQLNLEYARTCYGIQNSSFWDSTCGTFEKPRLNWTKEVNNNCPFGAEACSRDADVVTFDTGHINSHLDLGVNARAQDRITYRRVTQCTVLNDTRFSTTFANNDITGTAHQYKVAYANYGASAVHGTNYTYSYSNFADFYTEFTGAMGTTPFQVGTAFAYGATADTSLQSSSSFQPISQLTVDDADVGLLFLSFTGRYTQPVDDPWFSAHSLNGIPDSLQLLESLYRPDRQISTMGCTERHQFCTSASVCTLLGGADQVYADIMNKMQLTAKQNVTMDLLYNSATRSSLPYVVQEIAKTSSPVLAINNSATASFTISLHLPKDQWHLELDRWFSISMARLQRTVVEYATGQIAPQTKYLLPPQTSSENWLCRSQRINSTVFQSFDVVALVVMLVFGILIIVTSLNIERFATWVQLRWNVGGRGRDMWLDHDMLGKQRWRAMFASPQPSMHVNSPVVHIQSPYHPHGQYQTQSQYYMQSFYQMQSPQPNTQLASLQTNFPGFDAHRATSRRASSQALSPGDSARTFPSKSEKRSPPQNSPSPTRSAITADFIFDFGTERNSPSPPCTGYTAEKLTDEKPLPQAPREERNFVIERGLESRFGADITDEKRAEEGNHQTVPQVEDAVGSGPGRWAYYSAHKRRYGPRLAVPTPQVFSSPHVMTSNAGGWQGSNREGNWI